MLTSEAVKYFSTHPVEFVRKVIRAEPTLDQKVILESLVSNQMTSVRSGHGVGKSSVEAWALIWFMVTRPFPKIPCTAPTQHQLFDILWAEVSKWIRSNPALAEDLIWTSSKVYMRGHREEWFAVARTSTKPDALQGFHSENILYIIDEASGVDDAVFEPVLGSLSTEGARLLMCGNPTQLSGFFYDSHNKNRASYKTFRVDGRNSPLVSADYVQTIINMYGEDSDIFRVRVSGDFPKAEDDVFIPLPLCEGSLMTEYKPRQEPLLIHIGADIARFGDDKTCIGYKVDEKVEFYKKIKGQDTMKTADNIVSLGEMLIRRYHWTDTIPIKIDDGGVGGGVTDRLRQIKRNQPERFAWMDIIPVRFGMKIKSKYYDDSTTWMMAVIKKLLSPYDEDTGERKPVELILPDDDELIAQLSTRKYLMTERSKIRIESKKEVKKRGQHSPDEADCLCLMCCPVKPRKQKKEGDGR